MASRSLSGRTKRGALLLLGAPLALAIGAISASALVACRLLVGISDRAEDLGGDAGHACGALASGPAACGACTTSSCCTELAACERDAPCAATFGCIARCALGDEACRNACATGGALSRATLDLVACQARTCTAACALRCGGLMGLVSQAAYGGPVPPGCLGCVESSVTTCGQMSACASDPGCTGVSACLQACPRFDQACAQACEAADLDASVLLQGVVNQVASSCVGSCALGESWSCVGNVSWPVATPGTIDLTLGVTVYSTSTPIEGATVKACANLGWTCSQQQGSSAVTDDAGLATVRVPVTGGPNGAFSGYMQVAFEDGGYVPELFFPPVYPAGSQRVGPTQLIAKSVFDLLLGYLPVAPSVLAQHGHLFVIVDDCAGYPAPGVSLAYSSAGRIGNPFYVIGSSITATATETDRNAVGGAFDIDPGVVRITATARTGGSDAGDKAVVAVRDVTVGPGSITFVILGPTPNL